MSLKKKIKTAFTILKIKGLKAVIKVLTGKLDRRYRPDEAFIAFGVLAQADHKGIMIDVGAHHGGALAPFAQAGWQVFAFEPDDQNRAVLVENFGEFSNVHIDPRAISDHNEAEVAFFQSSESTGVSGLSAFLPSHKVTQTVSLISLEKFIKEKKLKGKMVDFLKTDTEGFDLMALKGFPWKDSQPVMVLCEFEDAKTTPLGYDFHTLAGFLLEKGYQLLVSEWYPVKQYGSLHHWRRFSTYPCNLGNPHAWGNIFAVADEVLYRQLLSTCGVKIQSD